MSEEKIDFVNLSPAPWQTRNWDYITWAWLKRPEGANDLAFIAVARNAFDVMMKRGWSTARCNKGWRVNCELATASAFVADDPFTALVEADRWYRENVEIHLPTST